MAGKSKNETVGQQYAASLETAMAAFAAAPLPGSRDLFHFAELKPKGGFASTQENAIVTASDFLASTGRVFTYGDSIVFEERSQRIPVKLVSLSDGGGVQTGAEHRLSNLMVCDGGAGQFPMPRNFVELLLRSETLRDTLPVIRTYAMRPLYDEGFLLRGPGWHADVGTLVHGPAIEPAAWVMPAAGLAAKDRLPPHLRSLLSGFCFKADADVANALALLLSVLLVARYVRDGKPLALIDGNQPSVGKTILARTIGIIADAADPHLMPYTANEEELRKSILAHLREGRGSLIGIDNAKVATGSKLESASLEALSSSAELAIRVLGTSTLFRRPNDLIWLVTMNHTRASDDLLRRGLPIRLEYEGNPESRPFGVDPVAYAFAKRLDILAELFSMVDHWVAAGRPVGTTNHRFHRWAAEVGGILNACGFPEFLSNYREAAAEFSSEAEDLAVLAEYVLTKGGPGLAPETAKPKHKALTAKEWGALFANAKVLEDELAAAKSTQAKATRIGQFLAKAVGKSVRVPCGEQFCALTLRSRPQRSNSKAYCFEVEAPPAESPQMEPSRPETPTRPSSGNTTGMSVTITASPGLATPPLPDSGIGNSEMW